MLLLVSIASLSAADRDSLRVFNKYPLVGKGSFQIGASFMSININGSNGNALLLLSGLDFSGNLKQMNPFISYAYKQDRAVGVQLDYSAANLSVSAATLDLLNEGLAFDVENVNASVRSTGVKAFHRWFVGLDRLSRFGFYYDTALSYSTSRIEYFEESSSDTYSSGTKLGFSFTPGVMIFVRNNVSVHVGADVSALSYNKIESYQNGSVTGRRESIKGKLGVDILSLAYGLSFHF